MNHLIKNTKNGIKENINQFLLLVVINLFVGSMVGLERTILPLIGKEQFGIASTSAALSFIVSFGFSKAFMNILAGKLADKVGRKQVLLSGWLIGLFVPILVILASSWWMIVCANLLLGIQQGLTWSMTVNMKVDLAKKQEKGMAVGFNEFAGYLGVGLMAFLSGYVASINTLSPAPFYLGIGIVLIGFVLSLKVKDTHKHLKLHYQNKDEEDRTDRDVKNVFFQTTWKDKNLSTISIAGMTTNLKDGMTWGLFPIFLSSAGLTVVQAGSIIAVYPVTWGLFQMVTGIVSDRIGRKGLVVSGMLLQSFSLWWILFVNNYSLWMIGSILLGIGTAMVYPTLIAAIVDVAHPKWRASSMGIYRFWRDSGYAFGALFAGAIADVLDVSWAIGLIASFPFFAGLNALFRLDETLEKPIN